MSSARFPVIALQLSIAVIDISFGFRAPT